MALESVALGYVALGSVAREGNRGQGEGIQLSSRVRPRQPPVSRPGPKQAYQGKGRPLRYPACSAPLALGPCSSLPVSLGLAGLAAQAEATADAWSSNHHSLSRFFMLDAAKTLTAKHLNSVGA